MQYVENLVILTVPLISRLFIFFPITYQTTYKFGFVYMFFIKANYTDRLFYTRNY